MSTRTPMTAHLVVEHPNTVSATVIRSRVESALVGMGVDNPGEWVVSADVLLDKPDDLVVMAAAPNLADALVHVIDALQHVTVGVDDVGGLGPVALDALLANDAGIRGDDVVAAIAAGRPVLVHLATKLTD